jgi:hypothetical protein
MQTSSNAACRHEGSQSFRQALSKQAVKQTGGLAVLRSGNVAGRQIGRQENRQTCEQADRHLSRWGGQAARKTGCLADSGILRI